MKILIVALLVLAAYSSNWNVLTSFPSCYTNVPFNVGLVTTTQQTFGFQVQGLPEFCAFDRKSGIITGVSPRKGSWPFSIRYTNRAGKYLLRDYLIHVVDAAQDTVWVGKSNNYYERKVQKPLRVLPSRQYNTAIPVGQAFTYKFGHQNQVGNAVYAFLNLPDGLIGNKQTGQISGVVRSPGFYTIGVQIGDQSGNSAQGYTTLVVGQKNTAGGLSLNKVSIPNNVPYVYDVARVQAQQIEADQRLFESLAGVNAAKAQLQNRQKVFDSINVNLAAAQASADKAAIAAAQANTDRQVISLRYRQTNKALNDAQDKLNLALLYQAGALSNLKDAIKALQDAQNKFNDAQKALAAAEQALQAAQAIVSTKRLNQAQANANLKNAQRDYDRANQDLDQAKKRLNQAEQDQNKAKDTLLLAKNDLSVAQKAYDQAQQQLKETAIRLANAQASRQAALQILRSATAANQKAVTLQGEAEWNLLQAIASLNVANAAKQAADRTSALIIANGIAQNTVKVVTTYKFSSCRNTILPRYSGSVRISKVYGDRAVLSTGNTIVYGDCTVGRNLVIQNQTVQVLGVINAAQRCIQVHEFKPVVLVK